MRKSVVATAATAAVAASLFTGAAVGAGAAFLAPTLAGAQTTPPTTPPGPGASPARPGHRGGGVGRGAGTAEAVSDLSVAAKAIGIPDADLRTALSSGQSLAAVAKSHSVDPQKVIDALVADARSELAAAVSSGKLTQAQADKAMTNLTQRITDQVNGVRGGPGLGGPGRGPGKAGPGGPGFGPGRGGAGRAEAVSDLSVAAKAIGIPEADVTTAVSSGQSLAAVAKAHSVDPQKVIDALVADAKSELAAAVSSGKLTQAQADKATTSLTQQITAQVNGVGRGHG